MMRALVLCWLFSVCRAQLCQQFCISASGSCSGPLQCPDSSCGAVAGANFGGALKLLDVNMFGWPAHTGRPAVATAAECCYACADTPGCNIWNFCPQRGGCGTGCTASKFGPTGTQEQAHNSYVPDPSNMYGPAFRFGNSTYAYNPLQYIPDSSWKCNDNGTFPFQTCTLKNTADPANPITYNAAGDTDWESGALVDLAAARAAKSKSRWITDCDTVPGGC